MKTIQISRTSWHYRFMKWTGGGYVNASDICEYSRMLVFRLIMAAIVGSVMSIMAGFIMFMIGSTIAWAVASIVSLSFLPPEPQVAASLIVGIGIGVPLALFVLFKQNQDAIGEALDTPFIRNAFSSWRDKWCARIEITDDK